MLYIIVAVGFFALGFGVAFLVFHNNEPAANKLVASAESDVAKVESVAKSVSSTVAGAANAVASDVKKA